MKVWNKGIVNICSRIHPPMSCSMYGSERLSIQGPRTKKLPESEVAEIEFWSDEGRKQFLLISITEDGEL